MSSTVGATRTPVFDFDFVADPTLRDDVFAGYVRLKKVAPPVFWTPHWGGHWVTTSAEATLEVLRRPEIYSSRYLSIPPTPKQPRLIPESLDPPEHRPYRQLLRPYFERSAIAELEPRIVAWTDKVIDSIAEKGECEFVETVASRLPVSVFMEMFGFPLERFDEFRGLVVAYFDSTVLPARRRELEMRIVSHLMALIQSRIAEPRDDLMSTLVHIDFEGRRLTLEELMSIGFLFFLAGLDTVTCAMTFGMRHLAHDETLRQRMIDDPASIPKAVEELMRRYSFVATTRYVVKDAELLGVRLGAGDSILVPTLSVGLDEATNPDPETVSIDRPEIRHAGFGSGVHACLGLHLARVELATFYRAWFSRIGHFREVEPAERPRMRAGAVMTVEKLHLAW